MSERATLIILAGGESKRMGQPKHLLPTAPGMTLIEHLHRHLSSLFTETLVVGNDPGLQRMGVRTVEDLYPLRCPLVGIYSGLLAANTDLCFVLACDMPFVKPGLIQALLTRTSGNDVTVPVAEGYHEPLCAAYRQSAIPTIKEALDQGTLKVTGIYEHLRVREVSERIVRQIDPELSSFVNLNTPRRLELLSRLRDYPEPLVDPISDTV